MVFSVTYSNGIDRRSHCVIADNVDQAKEFAEYDAEDGEVVVSVVQDIKQLRKRKAYFKRLAKGGEF